MTNLLAEERNRTERIIDRAMQSKGLDPVFTERYPQPDRPPIAPPPAPSNNNDPVSPMGRILHHKRREFINAVDNDEALIYEEVSARVRASRASAVADQIDGTIPEAVPAPDIDLTQFDPGNTAPPGTVIE